MFSLHHLLCDGNERDFAISAAEATSTLPLVLCSSRIAWSLVKPRSTILWMLVSGKLPILDMLAEDVDWEEIEELDPCELSFADRIIASASSLSSISVSCLSCVMFSPSPSLKVRRSVTGSSDSVRNGVSVSVVPIRSTFFFRSMQHWK